MQLSGDNQHPTTPCAEESGDAERTALLATPSAKGHSAVSDVRPAGEPWTLRNLDTPSDPKAASLALSVRIARADGRTAPSFEIPSGVLVARLSRSTWSVADGAFGGADSSSLFGYVERLNRRSYEVLPTMGRLAFSCFPTFATAVVELLLASERAWLSSDSTISLSAKHTRLSYRRVVGAPLFG